MRNEEEILQYMNQNVCKYYIRIEGNLVNSVTASLYDNKTNAIDYAQKLLVTFSTMYKGGYRMTIKVQSDDWDKLYSPKRMYTEVGLIHKDSTKNDLNIEVSYLDNKIGGKR